MLHRSEKPDFVFLIGKQILGGEMWWAGIGGDIFCDNNAVIQGGDHLVYLQLPKHPLSSQTMPSAASTATVE